MLANVAETFSDTKKIFKVLAVNTCWLKAVISISRFYYANTHYLAPNSFMLDKAGFPPECTNCSLPLRM